MTVTTEAKRVNTGNEQLTLVQQANSRIDQLIAIKAALLALRTIMQNGIASGLYTQADVDGLNADLTALQNRINNDL